MYKYVKYVVVYEDWCGCSMKAIGLLRSRNIPYKQISAERFECDPKYKKVPSIFKNGKFIGGIAELKKDLGITN